MQVLSTLAAATQHDGSLQQGREVISGRVNVDRSIDLTGVRWE